MNISINIEYFAQLRDERSADQEQWITPSTSVSHVYEDIQKKYAFSLNREHLRVAINEHFVDWETIVQDGDKVVFIPPVNGG